MSGPTGRISGSSMGRPSDGDGGGCEKTATVARGNGRRKRDGVRSGGPDPRTYFGPRYSAQIRVDGVRLKYFARFFGTESMMIKNYRVLGVPSPARACIIERVILPSDDMTSPKLRQSVCRRVVRSCLCRLLKRHRLHLSSERETKDLPPGRQRSRGYRHLLGHMRSRSMLLGVWRSTKPAQFLELNSDEPECCEQSITLHDRICVVSPLYFVPLPILL